MRIVILVGSAALLAGCVQQPPPLMPYQLQMAPPLPYRTEPLYRPPMPAPQNAPGGEPLPLIVPDETTGPGSDTSGTGAIPLQDMPAPTPETGSAPGAAVAPSRPSRIPAASSPVEGHGTQVPLEGFRPMRTQTQPTP